MKPNLFDWATSELSQDAFLCWLFEWSKLKYKKLDIKLHEISSKLILDFLGGYVKELKSVDVKKQYKNIDIVLVINKDYAILIEDKVNAANHSGQLKRYHEILKEEFDESKIILIYLKTGDQSDLIAIEEKGYRPFMRKDLLAVLEKGVITGITNDIFVDFYEKIKEKEEKVNSYKILPLVDWHWDSWKGYYSELQEELGGNWNYVAQRNGGFLGFWWFWQAKDFNGHRFEYYLQLEHKKFCFKLVPNGKEKAREIRDYYRSLLYPAARKHNIEIYQNGRIGKWMTVAALRNDVRVEKADGLIDMGETIKNIRKIESMILDI